jgi:uncharacterized protein (TIGR00730 family)
MKKNSNRKKADPVGADPQHREQPLPWHQPKSVDEDPDAGYRVDTIMNSPSYRQADRDVDFLNQDETRGVRLQIDYLKPELLLREHRVRHTIVVFGGTRIREPAAAKRRVAELQMALNAAPEDVDLQQKLAVAERLLAKSQYYDAARAFARLVSECSELAESGRLVVMTGGGPGVMEAANRGAFDVGARSVGLNITLPHEQYPNPYITPELCFSFHYFALRKLHFLMRARALVAFPGGYGTMDELFETLTLVQTQKIEPVPIVLVGENYWRRVFNVDFMVDEGVIDPEDRDLLWYAETAEEAWESILHWYEAAGKPLIHRD